MERQKPLEAGSRGNSGRHKTEAESGDRGPSEVASTCLFLDFSTSSVTTFFPDGSSLLSLVQLFTVCSALRVAARPSTLSAFKSSAICCTLPTDVRSDAMPLSKELLLFAVDLLLPGNAASATFCSCSRPSASDGNMAGSLLLEVAPEEASSDARTGTALAGAAEAAVGVARLVPEADGDVSGVLWRDENSSQ